jgi:hypothetical protein
MYLDLVCPEQICPLNEVCTWIGLEEVDTSFIVRFLVYLRCCIFHTFGYVTVRALCFGTFIME